MEQETLFIRNLTKEQKLWAKHRCLELSMNLGEYVGRLIDREKNTITKARTNRKPKVVKRDPRNK